MSGFKTEVVIFNLNKEQIFTIVNKRNPLVVGFSVIFEHFIDDFIELIRFLRQKGIDSHFTAGGHYASICTGDLLLSCPGIDSVVRFEGENTFPDLVRCIHNGEDWKKINNIAFRENGKIVFTALKPLENDLDKFPYPERMPLKEFAFGKKFATLIAGRGCVHNCSFCNGREFFIQASGPLKRIRSPESVAGEMQWLYSQKECAVFLFEDDDFPVRAGNKDDWIREFCNALKRNSMTGRILWKINCRPDEINYDSVVLMKESGLFLVFLGIDDGTDEGLKGLNKNMTVSQSLKGIEILKSMNLDFDYGFLLFQPSTTFRLLRTNLEFLLKICGDGYTPLTFLKLIPYFKTRTETELKEQGRLKGRPGYLDYDFIEPSMNSYFDFINKCFMTWQRDVYGMVNVSKWVRNYFAVYRYFYGYNEMAESLHNRFRNIISESNKYVIKIMNQAADLIEFSGKNDIPGRAFSEIRADIRMKHNAYLRRVHKCIDSLASFVYPHY